MTDPVHRTPCKQAEEARAKKAAEDKVKAEAKAKLEKQEAKRKALNQKRQAAKKTLQKGQDRLEWGLADCDAPDMMIPCLQGPPCASPNTAGVVVEILQAGSGAIATRGKRVSVNYVGRLAKNGKEFDRSRGK